MPFELRSPVAKAVKIWGFRLEASIQSSEKKRVALWSVAAALFITAAKLIVGLETNSLGVLSEAAHSGLDLIAAVMTFFAVSISGRPADRDHHYGHGKIENVSALFETLLLVFTCGWIIYEGIHRLTAVHPQVEANVWSFGVIAVAIVVDFGRARSLSRVARKYKSQALEADALHFSSDIWSSLVVLLGLFFVSAGYPWMDAIAAIGVAVLVLVVSYRLGRRTIDALMDRVPHDVPEQVKTAIGAVAGIEAVSNLRLRHVGDKTFADVVVGIDRTVSFEHAHRIMEEVEAAVRRCVGEADVVVHGEPHRRDDERLEEQIKIYVTRAGLPEPHHVRIHQVEGRTAVEFHLEFEPGKTLRAAHDVASGIEAEIRREWPAIGAVTIHMEERSPRVEQAAVSDDRGLQEAVRRDIEKHEAVAACSRCQLLRVGSRYHMSITCSFRGDDSLTTVHRAVSQLERLLYQKYPLIERITIHPEPAKGE